MSRAVLKLEFIAENYFEYKRRLAAGEITERHAATEHYGGLLGRDKSRPWVARLLGRDGRFGWKREFVRAQKDYSQANALGTRGVFLYYALTEGIYEVNERTSWQKVRRYFIRVNGATFVEISREEVEQCLDQWREGCHGE